MADRKRDSHPPDTFVPITRDDVSDIALLPARFNLLAGEVRELLGVLRHQVVPQLADIRTMLADIRREGVATDARVAEVSARVEELGALVLVPR